MKRGNPYLATTRGGNAPSERLPISAFSRADSRESLVNSAGEINATDKRDLMKAISTLANIVGSGQALRPQDERRKASDLVKARMELVEAAIADRSGNSWIALGEVLGDEIWETTSREGFTRRTLLLKELQKGEIGRLRIRRKDVIAHFVTTSPYVVENTIKQPYVYPDEYYLLCKILIEIRELQQSPGDLLDEKYTDGLEQIMVEEDKITRNLFNQAAGSHNDLFFYTTFNPIVFSSMRTQVARWGIPVTTALIAFDLWDDIIADTEFSAWWDPVSKHEIITEGSIGSILGIQLITDAYRYPTLKVMEEGESYFLGAPQTLGGITQRQALEMEPIDEFNRGRATRGWFGHAIQGTAVVNSRAIVRGQRS
jgi:hypothetical protein